MIDEKPSAVEQRLDNNCTFDLRVQSTLGEALELFAQITQIPVRMDLKRDQRLPIIIDTMPFESHDATAGARVYVKIPVGTWRQVLEIILKDAGGGLAYRVEGEELVVFISNPFAPKDVVRMYSIEDLLPSVRQAEDRRVLTEDASAGGTSRARSRVG